MLFHNIFLKSYHVGLANKCVVLANNCVVLGHKCAAEENTLFGRLSAAFFC